jgi:hypothetical protein
MTNCKRKSSAIKSAGTLRFTGRGTRQIEGSFDGGAMTSDAGLLLIREVDRKLGLTQTLARAVEDQRQSGKTVHRTVNLIRQRVYAICAGYEDLNDHDTLRHDRVLQLGAGRDGTLASAATLCRAENRADRAAAWAAHGVLVDQFIASHASPPEEIVLDFDATDDPTHGQQEGRFFHAYYGHYCYMPLYVFCGEQLLVAYLRPSNIDGAKHSAGILKLLVTRIRQDWPDTRIIVRGDSGFCRRRLLHYCERSGVNYVIGLARNKRLQRADAVRALTLVLRERFERRRVKQRACTEFRYAAKSWNRRRRVIARIEWNGSENNPRFVVTNLDATHPLGRTSDLYDRLYCARGEMENRIKEAQLGLFADRTSCHRFDANQWRLILSSLAYVLVERLRSMALEHTEMARAQASTIRVKLIKIGAVLLENTRRITLKMPSAYPYQATFAAALAALRSP